MTGRDVMPATRTVGEPGAGGDGPDRVLPLAGLPVRDVTEAMVGSVRSKDREMMAPEGETSRAGGAFAP